MANPTLREEVFNSLDNRGDSLSVEKSMTETGTLLKTLVLGGLLTLSAAYTWYLVNSGFADKAFLLGNIGFIGGFIIALFICWGPKNKYLCLTAPIYALLEGLMLGGYSAALNAIYPGIVSQAVIGTMMTIFAMYIVYATKIIKVTDTFLKTVLIATMAVAGIYILQLFLSLFHITIPHLFSNSLIGIGFSAVVCVIAAFNLLVDFEFINRFKGMAPSYMEWYGAFSLMVTIVWLYLEILRLLAKISSRR